MQESLQDKQSYLRVNILEAGHDPQHFIEFLHTQTGQQNPDIAQFSMTRIQQLVQQFRQRSQNQPDHLESKDSNQSPNKPTDSSGHMIEQRKTKIEYERYSPMFDYEIKGKLPCLEADRLVTGILQVEVTGMEKEEVEGYIFGLGSRTDIYYKVKSSIAKEPVKRLSEDFDWLNKTLKRLYPHVVLPELEAFRKNVKEPEEERRKEIETYLKYLSKKELLLCSQVFVDFLTLGMEKIDKYKRAYDSMVFSKGVSTVKSPEGSLEIELSNQARKFYTESNSFCKKSAKIHESLSQAVEKMIDSCRVAKQDTYMVVDMFADLYGSYCDLNNKFPSSKRVEYCDVLVSLNNLFLGIGDSIKNTSDIVEKFAKQYFRFSLGHDRNLGNLYRSVRQSEKQYLEFKYNLYRKKQRVISDPSKWEIDSQNIDVKALPKHELIQIILPKETLQQSQLKIWYAFSLKNLQFEFFDYLRMSTHRYLSVFKEMSKELLSSDKSYLEALVNFIGECRRTESM